MKPPPTHHPFTMGFIKLKRIHRLVTTCFNPCGAADSHKRSRDWANLPQQLILSIAGRLTATDCFRLHSVCKPWASAMANYPHYPPSNSPWLMLMNEKRDLSFFNLSTARLYPAACPLLKPPNFRCVGCHGKWLVIFNNSSYEPFLLNPFTRAHILLPSWAAFAALPILKVVLSSSPSSPSVGGGVIAVALYEYPPRCGSLAFARPGDRMWTSLGFKVAVDIVFHDGRLYAVDAVGRFRSVDLTARCPESTWMSSDTRNDYIQRCLSRSSFPVSYLSLVSSSGDLLQVWVQQDRACRYWTIRKFFVSKFKGSRWVKADDLGDLALLLGWQHCLSVSAATVPGVKRNCIYFADSMGEGCPLGAVRVFDMEKETVEPCHSSELQIELFYNGIPPTWLAELN